MAAGLTWIRLRDYMHQHGLSPAIGLRDDQGQNVREITLEDDGIRLSVGDHAVPATFSRLAGFCAQHGVPGDAVLYLALPRGIAVPVTGVDHRSEGDAGGGRYLILHG